MKNNLLIHCSIKNMVVLAWCNFNLSHNLLYVQSSA